MSAIKTRNQPQKQKDYSIVKVGGIITIAGLALFAYLMWYVAPVENIEMVKVVAITENGCIGETFDGYAVNIGDCGVQSGEVLNVPVDQKTKERAALMNPTR